MCAGRGRQGGAARWVLFVRGGCCCCRRLSLLLLAHFPVLPQHARAPVKTNRRACPTAAAAGSRARPPRPARRPRRCSRSPTRARPTSSCRRSSRAPTSTRCGGAGACVMCATRLRHVCAAACSLPRAHRPSICAPLPPTRPQNPSLDQTAKQVLVRARPTVSPGDLAQYEKFTDEFGEEAS